VETTIILAALRSVTSSHHLIQLRRGLGSQWFAIHSSEPLYSSIKGTLKRRERSAPAMEKAQCR